MEQQRISPDELAQKLVNSKKIMKKVDTGDYQKGNIDEAALIGSDEGPLMEGEKPLPAPRSVTKPVGQINPEKVKQSKLPDAIKQAMIDHPIPQISLNENISMDFLDKAKQLMEKEGDLPRSNQKQTATTNLNELVDKLSPIIENIVRKVLDEKLNQILSAQQMGSINENFAIKVGDTIFQGKLTKSKKAK